MRQQRSLSGRWQFQLDPAGALTPDTVSPDRAITVPLPWQAAFPDLRQYGGFAWYRRMTDLDPEWLAGQLLLRFGAVDYWCQVYVNGQLCGEHEGGYTPFVISIHTAAKAGSNVLAVRVYDPVQTGIVIPRWPDDVDYHAASQPPFNARDIPHGKQEWYINVEGIWQDVTLMAVPTSYIEQAHITTDIYTGRVDLAVTLTGDLTTLDGELSVAIEGTEAQAHIQLELGQPQYQVSVTVPQPRWWSPESPNLYTAVVRLSGAATDEVRSRFGFREITTRDGQLLLNGAPLYLLCALDQDLYPETIYTVPSEHFLRDQFAKAKALGLNSLRCHIKPPDPLYLDLADEMGLLIWSEIPSWRTFYPKTTVHPNQLLLDDTIKHRVENTLIEMIRRDFNHPSIIIWTMVNEDWGTALSLSADDRAWVARMYDMCKRLDPTRLVVDNSPCTAAWGPNVHVKSDLDDYHIYMNIPDNAENFEQFIEQFGLRPLWTYSSQGDAQRVGNEPLVLSEFGNWGLPSLRALMDANGKLPAWFDLGPWWSSWDGEPGWPRDVLRRFEALGLNAIWSDYEAFAQASQWHQFYAMKFEIEAIRRQPALTGYVITELSDIYWESNGLLDFNRNPKVYHDEFAKFNAPDVVVAQLDHYVTWDDQALPCRIYGSHYSAADWKGASLTWDVNGAAQHRQPIPNAVERGEVALFGTYLLDMPTVDRASRTSVNMSLRDAQGNELTRNDLPILVLPAADRAPAYDKSVVVLTRQSVSQPVQPVGEQRPQQESAGAAGPAPDEPRAPRAEFADQPAQQPGNSIIVRNLASTIRQLGYDVRETLLPDAELIITDFPDAAMLNWVREGGTLLYLSGGPGPFFWRQGRAGAYGGGWITSFSWLRPGVYRRLQVANPLLLPFREIMPTGAIVGLPVDNPAYQRDFLAGQVSGWLQHPAVHTVQFRYGRGKVLMTTYPLKIVLMERGPHPLAVAMLHDLVEYITSGACQPTLQANY